MRRKPPPSFAACIAAAVAPTATVSIATAQDLAGVDLGSSAALDVSADVRFELDASRADEDRPFAPPIELKAPPPIDPDAPGSRLSVTAGVGYVNAYFFRGILQEEDGFIFQPYLDIGVSLIERDGWSLGLILGTWSSIHGDTGTAADGSSLPNYYELDLYGGASLSLGRVTAQVLYIAYVSPSDAFDTIEEIDLSLGWDDSDAPLLGPFTLTPSLTLAFEVGDDDALGDDPGGYAELAIAPAYTFGD